MAGTRPEESEAVSEQPLCVLSGREALARFERAICPGAVSREPAVAEGLALAGVRAASLGDGGACGASAGIALSGVSCVHHVDGDAGGVPSAVFELAAASVQEAVDHCLVAHRLSRRLGRPGHCSLAPSLAGGLSPVRLPGREQRDELLEAAGVAAEPGAGEERILELAGEAFAAVEARTSRPAAPVDHRGKRGAPLVLVGSGAAAARAREVERALSSAGVAAGALSVNLVRPFPEAAVRDALAGARTVLVVEDPSGRGALLGAVRAAAGPDVEVRSLPAGAPVRMLEALAEHLPEGAVDPRAHAPLPEPLDRRLVVAPGGPWGEETARQLAAALGELGPLRVAPRSRRHRGATVLAWNGEAVPGAKGDVLVASHPALLDARGPLALVRPGATAVVLSGAGSSEELAQQLEPAAREALLKRELSLHWAEPPDTPDGEPVGESDRAASLVLAGAALRALRHPAARSGAQAAAAVAARLEAGGRTQAARWLREGAERVRALDPAALDPSRHVEELDFRPEPALPRMPEPVDDPEQRERWAERARSFHRTGRGAFGAVAHLPVRPAALGGVAEALRATSPHPFALVPSEDPEPPLEARPLRELLEEGIEALRAAGPKARALADNLGRLATLAARELARRAPGAELEGLLSEAGRRLVDELSLPEDEERTLVEDLEALCRRLPGESAVLDLRPDTPVRLYRAVLDAARARIRRRFAAELEELRERLRDLLQLDRMGSSEGRTAEAVAAALGSSGAQYLDPEALSRTLTDGSGSERLAGERRERIERALAVIEDHLENRDPLPRAVFLRRPGTDLPVPEEEQREHPDPLAAAVGLFDGLARRMAVLFRAVRTARLEATARYRAERHEAPLAALDWEGFTAEELMLVPAVAVVTTGRRLRQCEAGSLSQLLVSSRPVHVIVQDQVGATDEAEDLSRFHVDLGYLVMAHREAFAVGSTLARPGCLTEGMARMARALRPCVALVSLPAFEPAPWRPLLAEAALHGRACPEFRYDPDAGPSWADRFELGSNPQPERSWPRHQIAYLEGGAEQTLELAFTFADAVALEPAYLRHLRIVPRAAWDDELQRPLAEHLERLDPQGREPSIPYLWVVDEEGTLQRAVVTRALAMACHDRLRAWRVLQELAGYQNQFAARAAAEARERARAEAEAQRAELEREHGEELDRARREGAHESMERLAAVLVRPDAIPAASAAPVPRPAEPPLSEPEPVRSQGEPAAVEEVLEEEEALAFDEPYIDTPLCTTCNECTHINAQLFQYNAEKQAFIADAAAGSFAELVKAAELCPARCIHPGKPRSDDPTATPELIGRAAPFNG